MLYICQYEEVLSFPVPIIDGEFIQDRPEKVIKTGKFNGNNFVFSFTQDEGAYDGESIY